MIADLAVGTPLAGTTGMPSFEHEKLVELFRKRPSLATELLASAGIQIKSAAAECASIDLTQIVPTEYRSDAVTVLRDPEGKVIAAVVVEVQLGADEDKRWTWPLYVAAARASYRCPTTLLVLAPRRAVAGWARQPIELGHPEFALRPIVIDYPQIPCIRQATAARVSPELVVLSAIAHPGLETVMAADAALHALPEDLQGLYWTIIYSRLPVLVRRAVEGRMLSGFEFKSAFARKFAARQREEGRREGRQEGREEGREEVREILRHKIVEIVGARFPGLREEVADRVRGQPEAWLTTAVVELSQARDEAEVRAILGRRRRPTGQRSPRRRAG